MDGFSIGALIGGSAGLIYGSIKARSLNDVDPFGIVRPMVVMLYALEGAVIGAVVGIVAYLIFKHPWSPNEGNINEFIYE